MLTFQSFEQNMPELDMVYVPLKLSSTMWFTATFIMSCWIGSAMAACLPLAKQAKKQEIEYFIFAPDQALIKAHRDEGKLSEIIARYVGTDLSVLGSVKTMADTAPSRYKRSIGAGLGIAQQQCLESQPLWANRIQAFVGGLQDLDLNSGYRASFEAGHRTAAPINSARQVLASPRAAEDLRLTDPFKPLPIPAP